MSNKSLTTKKHLNKDGRLKKIQPSGKIVRLLNPQRPKGVMIKCKRFIDGEPFVLSAGKYIDMDSAYAKQARNNWKFLEIKPIPESGKSAGFSKETINPKQMFGIEEDEEEDFDFDVDEEDEELEEDESDEVEEDEDSFAIGDDEQARQINYEKYKYNEQRDIAGILEIENYYHLKKDELLAAVSEASVVDFIQAASELELPIYTK